MLRGEDRFAMQHEGFANRFFLRELLFGETQRFSTITRASVSRNRLVKREDAHGFGRRVFRVLQTLFMIAGLDVVMSELLDRARRSLTILLESFGDVSMQATTADRVDLLVKHFANFVVRETERVARAGGNQLRPRGFVERIEHHVFSLFSHDGELFKREDFAKDRRDAQHVVTVLTNAIQTIANRFLDALRDQHLVHVTTAPAPTLAPHRAALDQCLQNFFDEERIAFSLAMHCNCKLATHAFAQQRAELVAGFSLVEATQSDARDQSFAVPVDEGFGERMRAVEFGFAIRADDQHAFGAQLTQQVTEQPERAAIRPVQVVGVKQQRLAAGDVGEYLDHVVEKQQALFVRRQCLALGKRAETSFDFRRELCDLNRRVAEQLAQIVVVLLFANPTSKRFYERQVRRRRFVFVTAAGRSEEHTSELQSRGLAP